MILSGGADACVTPGMIFGFSKMRAVVDALQRHAGGRVAAVRSPAATASCSARAPGWWCSSAKTAPARAARAIYATIDGYGSTCDAYHRVQMDPDGEQIVRAMRLAIERSGRPLEEIGYVNYHGTSTVLNDAVESRCVRQLFGSRADRVPGSSTKSMIGHPQGASGAAGIVTAALALRARLPAADDQSDAIRIPTCDPRLHSQRRPQPRRRRPRSATASASARRTARSCSAGRRARQLIAGSPA